MNESLSIFGYGIYSKTVKGDVGLVVTSSPTVIENSSYQSMTIQQPYSIRRTQIVDRTITNNLVDIYKNSFNKSAIILNKKNQINNINIGHKTAIIYDRYTHFGFGSVSNDIQVNKSARLIDIDYTPEIGVVTGNTNSLSYVVNLHSWVSLGIDVGGQYTVTNLPDFFNIRDNKIVGAPTSAGTYEMIINIVSGGTIPITIEVPPLERFI